MFIKPIRDEQSYNQRLKRIEELWGAEIGTPDGDELDVILTLVEAYEEKHYPMPPSDPVEATMARYEKMAEVEQDVFLAEFQEHLVAIGNRMVIDRYDEGGISSGMVEALFKAFALERLGGR